MKTWNKGTAERVREIARKLYEFVPGDIYESQVCREETLLSRKVIQSVLRDFLKSGEIKKCEGPKGRFWFRYLGPVARGSGVREKVYRAMHVKGLFTVRDISVLSDGESSYICSLVRKLTAAGDVESAGKAPGPRRPEPAFRVKNGDQFFLKYVKDGSRGDAEAQGKGKKNGTHQ